MAPLKYLALVVIGACCVTGDMDAPDAGNWTVPNCIVVKMAGKLTLLPVEKNESISIEVPIPHTAVSNGDCTQLKNQSITLSWEDMEKDTNLTLNRNLTVTFKRNDTSVPPVYGVFKVEGVYETEHFTKESKRGNETYNVTYVQYITFSSYTIRPLEFQTPLNRSYLCMDVGTISMVAELHDSSQTGGSSGDRLNNATFTAKNVQLDAFRPEDMKENQLQTPLDCSFRPSDVVPIVVGCALAGTVLLVLIAYLVGRRKNRARGYQSV